MMRTLIAVLATAAISLPAAAQQTDTGQQGSRQYQRSQSQAQSMDQAGAGSRRATTGERRGAQMGGPSRGYAVSQRGEHQFRGRTGYYESRRRYGVRGYGVGGQTTYEGYTRGPRYSYIGGRRVYAEGCPRYIYINGRRVFNERCAGYFYPGRTAYFYERGARYPYVEGRRVFSTREYGTRRGGVYTSRRMAGGAYGFSRRGEGAGAIEQRGTAFRGGGNRAAQGQFSQSRSSRAAPSGGNRFGTQRQTEPQQGTR